MPRYEFSYASVAESEAVMLDDVMLALDENEVEPDVAHRASLVISEAYTNAYTHGNQRDPEKTIKLVLEINETRVCADIIDEGRGGLARIEKRKPPEPLGDSGRGVDLIRHCSNQVVFKELATGGLKVTVTVFRACGQKSMKRSFSGGPDGH